MDNIKITYEYPRDENQNDPCFYTDGGHSLVATVTQGSICIDIYCDGEMRINYHHNGEITVIRDSSHLIKMGIESDEVVFAHNESGQFDWVNNSWFDIYSRDHQDGEQGWLDIVTHDLSDAITSAIDAIKEKQGVTAN